jgi:hypothetical protein
LKMKLKFIFNIISLNCPPARVKKISHATIEADGDF